MSFRISATITATLMLVLLAGIALAEDMVKLENEFIRIVVTKGPAEAGRFSIKTTGGDPSRPASKNQHLIFAVDSPWTSYSTILLDGEKYGFGGKTNRRAGLYAKYGDVTMAPVAKDGKIVSATSYGNVEVTQELSFVRGPGTRMLDTAGIKYRIANNGDRPHTVGVRVMLDTMCGSNDGAPVRAATQAITSATRMEGSKIPDYWQAFDSLANPTVISQGTLRGGEVTQPDAIVFADWGTLADEPWQPRISDDMGFIRKGEDEPDTAVAVYWEPVKVEPGKSVTFMTYYGIGEVSLKPGQLTLGLTAPAETTFLHERTEPFTITGYLQNAGGFDGRNVKLKFTLPEGLDLIDGSPMEQSYATLKAGETVALSWRVKANGNRGGALKLNMNVASANIEPNQIARTIDTHVPTPTMYIRPTTQLVPSKTNGRPTIVPMSMNLSPAEKLHGMRFILRYDPAVVKPFGGVSRGLAFVHDDGRLLGGWEFDDSQDGVIRVSGTRASTGPITQAEANIASVNFRVVGTGKCTLEIEDAVLINDKGEEMRVKISPAVIEVTE